MIFLQVGAKIGIPGNFAKIRPQYQGRGLAAKEVPTLIMLEKFPNNPINKLRAYLMAISNDHEVKVVKTCSKLS